MKEIDIGILSENRCHGNVHDATSAGLKFVHQTFRVTHPHDFVLQSDWRHLSESPEVNSLNPPILPGSFLPHTERGNEPGDNATQT